MEFVWSVDILLTAKGIIDGGDGLREYMSLLWLKVSNRVHGLVTPGSRCSLGVPVDAS